MNWNLALPVLFLLLAAVLFAMGRRRPGGGLFRQALPQLLLLFLLSAAAALLHGGWLGALAYAPRLRFFLWLLFWFFLLVLAVKVVAYFIFDYLVQGKQGVRYPKLIKDVVVFILFVAGVLLILKYYLGQPVSGLLASTAVLTVVIGFALQDVLGNLFSGIVLNFEDAFKIGDWVRVGEREGRVEQFGWRSFKVRTVDRELIVIPNQSAAKAEVLIYGAGRQPVALKVQVAAGYGDSPDRVGEAVLSALAAMPDVRAEPPPVVYLSGFGDSSLNYTAKFWVDDYERHAPIASDARRRIWYAFRRGGIEIPFPKRDVTMKTERAAGLPRGELEAGLRRNGVLAALGDAEFQALLPGVEQRVYGAGETVIREGEAGDHFHHIHSGAARVLKEGQVVARLGPGDFFGEISLVTGDPTNATVVAERECLLLSFSRERFKAVVDMSEAVARSLAEVITRRQEETRDFSARNRPADAAALRKDSDNLLRRILKYFGGKK
ncbi:MAG TPA: mechanosensitive ion channel family protein [Candidatus Aminicenantes bacterium]|nr:mechanosensitive ion channel family protein [Candidatus Aminicenantes bacterium]